jgi:sulfite reductase subunit B
LNPYQPIKCRLREVIPETPEIRTFILESKPMIRFEAGQFVELTVPEVGEAPFTPSSSPYDHEKLELTVMRVGRVTNALFESQPGATLWIRGPYGQPYPLTRFEGREIFIVGGGVGLAPLRSLFSALIHNPERYSRIYLRYGARSPKDIIYHAQLEEWKELSGVSVLLTVDQGDASWRGRTGVVTTILDEIPVQFLKNTVGVVCGPPLMMKFTTQRLLEAGFSPENLYLSMEKNMSCGIGKCGHCRMGRYFVCKDGPVLTWAQIKDLKEPFL